MPFEIKESETAVPAMAYLDMRLVWGKLIAPKAVRAATWLKMSMVPGIFTFTDAEILVFGGSQPARLSTPACHLPTAEIIAFHVLPPATVELDYDPNEPNREMKPVTALASIFRFDGTKRISTLADFVQTVQSNKEPFSSLYDVTVSHPVAPGLKGITVPLVLMRSSAISYLMRN
jgi:hypothetical protein